MLFCEKFSELLFRKTYRRSSPPPPRRQQNGRGPKFWTPPPNQKPVGTALETSLYSMTVAVPKATVGGEPNI